MDDRFSLPALLGQKGPGIAVAMHQGLHFLEHATQQQLLEKVGECVFPEPPHLDLIPKSALPTSYGGAKTGPSDDFLVGRGLFYINEQRRLLLDCTSGHYQMLWGYNHPVLCRIIEEGTRAGIVWDNHSNIPQSPLKQLAFRLTEAANAPGEVDPLDTALLGICTGSVACGAALKIQLKVHERIHGTSVPPVILVLAGNYHGTDMVPQFMRGLWPHLPKPIEVATLPPNDPDALDQAFRKHGSRVAGFWAEPVMMNREAIAVQADYLQLARHWCDQTGALLCIDEIQTCFWQPEIFAFRALELRPDLVVAGKGMTAGYHPLSAVLFRRRHDVLAQYDAISTNGSASMPALVALGCLELIRQNANGIRAISQRIEQGFRGLANEFPERLESAQGRGYLSGMKFRRVQDALDFHGRSVSRGLWTRVHAYHEGHSTLLTKLGLLADEAVVEYMFERIRAMLQKLPLARG